MLTVFTGSMEHDAVVNKLRAVRLLKPCFSLLSRPCLASF